MTMANGDFQKQKKMGDENDDVELSRFPTLSQAMEELKELCGIGLPVTAMNLVVYVRAMVSVLCMGRLGSLELAGGALAIGFTNITGYSVLYGLATGMDPICSQAFGSRNFGLMSLSLQRTILILLSASIPICLLWLNLETILLSLGQDPQITRIASIYCRYALPDLLTNSLLQPLRIFLRSQGITAPMMWCSLLAVAAHVPLTWFFVFVLRLGVSGVATATWLTNLNMLVLLLAYVAYSGACKPTWSGWSAESLKDWWGLLHLALPSCFAVCLEWWWYEIMTLLAGYLPSPQVTVAAAAIVIQTTSLMYAFPVAIGSSVSTRVGNELGARRPARARHATIVALGCALLVALVSLTWTTVLRNMWGRVFTDDKRVLSLIAAVLPIIGICELGNCPQTTGCGVLRGSARPIIGARINLGSFYLVGTPVALYVAFTLKQGFVGLMYGLVAAQVACSLSIMFVISRTDWALEASRAMQLTAASSSSSTMNKVDEEMGLLQQNPRHCRIGGQDMVVVGLDEEVGLPRQDTKQILAMSEDQAT